MEEADCFRVRIVSENCQSLCHYTPEDLFALNTFQTVFPHHQQSIFTAHMQQIHKSFLQSGESQEPKVTTVSFIDIQGKLILCCCATHFVGGEHNLFICEFEPLKFQAGGEDDLPATPVNTLGSDLSGLSSQFSQYMVGRVTSQSLSEALTATEDTSLEFLAVVGQIHQRFASAHTIPELLEEVIDVLHDLTKFHRCMVYEFDHMYNGCVVAELVDSRASVDSYKGLHFPASDIPKQARDLVCIAFVLSLKGY
jgi:hypothetical protein